LETHSRENAALQPRPISLSTEVKYLKGVGPARAEALTARGIVTFEDLLRYLPFRYEDRIRFTPIRAIAGGSVVTVKSEVVQGSLGGFGRRPGAVYYLTVCDPSGTLHCRFFHGAYLEGRFRPGQGVILHGKAEFDSYRPGRVEMINPEFEMLNDDSADSTEVGRIVPIYEAIAGISSRMLRRIISNALSRLEPSLPDPLPEAVRGRLGLPPRRQALEEIHFPPPTSNLEDLNQFATPAQRRMIFEELFYYQLGLALRRREVQQEPGHAFSVREDRIREAVKKILPFKPTAAQKRVLAEIAADLERPAPMNRLLLGDVGSGKTLVAFETAVIVMENGYQAALMAPTEVLAVQHHLTARRLLGSAGYRVEILISGMKPAEKRAVLEGMRTGATHFVVGTHALLEAAAQFHKLGLVIVDEQHRFGVLQRKQLMEKGERPDVLVMTATPIPRTLSLTVYGDLDQSVIDELPPGRTAVGTRVTSQDNLPGVWEFVRGEVAKGRQAFVVYPVIEESKVELKAAVAEYERLSRRVFPQLRVGLLHGRLKSEEKEAVIESFRRGEISILVSTTVIEVGVDVPNATVMVIEHADRFGLAQLHQLRGRVGRGSERSYCVLVAPRKMSPEANERLTTLVRTNNGFEIAEADLRLRGPGELFGTRQHGDIGFHVANPLRDFQILELARREALAFLEKGGSSELARLMDFLGPQWKRRYQLAAVG
jgi:ATP-dependent DNA helicase RecG